MDQGPGKMSLKLQPNVGLQTVLKEGTRMQQGLEEAVFRNIAAVCDMASITRSSFGPNGLNKLIVNQLGKLFLTADAGTILKELEIQHPSARIILLASQQQDAEMGDGTNAVILLAGALLEKARELLKMGLKPSVVKEGYDIAHMKAQEFLDGLVIKLKAQELTDSGLGKIVSTVLMAKQYGVESVLSKLVMDACLMTGEHESKDEADRLQLVNPDNIRCVKVMGGTLNDSSVMSGVVLSKLAESTNRTATNCHIAIYACPIDITQTETKGTVLFNNAAEMMAFSKGEEDLIESRIKGIADAGVKILVTNEKIGEMAMHFINRYNLIALRVPSKFDVQRLCRTTGSPALNRFIIPAPDTQCGWCESVETVEIGGNQCTLIKNSHSSVASIILRGAALSQMDDYERAIEDAINVVRVLAKRDDRVVAGAGATEAELSRLLDDYAAATPGIVQYSLRAFASALESIPAALAANAGYDRTDAVSKLLSAHQAGHVNTGIAIDGTSRDPICDAVALGILDSVAVKKRSLSLAYDAASTVLMTDQIIMSKPAGGPKPRAAGPQDD